MRGEQNRGFTLIELLVALTVLALMAVMGWRGVDGLLRTRETVQTHTATVLGWQTALAQWQADWDAWAAAAVDLGDDVPRWSTSGQTVRLLRRSVADAQHPPGWQVVAWAATDGGTRWTRWQSPALTDTMQLAQYWAAAPQRVRDDGVRTVAIDGWNLQVWTDGAWQPAADTLRPVAVRLALTPRTPGPLSGPVQVDWLAPWVAGGKR
ncbi:PulJ/GspJ family protein [Tepidimonas sp. HKU77]|jgi:general secretion pathway protein J|uniref:PulJ/GspJ family protein n=1 Tax=Tepidimonas sp. HKU77 TaxID=3414503 RepID=UPI003C7DBCEA